ncbi:MAG: DUF1667 domain-containing protein [Fusobacteriaceae bacterium]
MKNLICIVCPIGCHLSVDIENDYKVTGHTCPRGEKYGKEELLTPKRVVTSTVKIKGALYERIPVKTNSAIPKEKINQCMELLNGVELTSPIKMGDVVIENIFNLGINIVATRDM